eukprot:15470588-Alexandrium_andersonii.AAC.1
MFLATGTSDAHSNSTHPSPQERQPGNNASNSFQPSQPASCAWWAWRGGRRPPRPPALAGWGRWPPRSGHPPQQKQQ